MIIDFGSEPTTDPPTDGAWVWAGDQWVEVVTDTGDDIPEELDLDGDGESLAVPLLVQVGDQAVLGSIHRFHLPGKHDQKSHGNKVGKKNLVQTKTGIGRYAYLQRKGTNNAHLGDVVTVGKASDGTPVAESLRNREGTVLRWVNDNRAEIEFSDGEVTDVHKDFLKVERTSQEIAEDAKGGDRAGNAKTILKGHYGDRFHLIGKETEHTRMHLSDLAKVPSTHHKIVSKHLAGSPTGGLYVGHAPTVDLSPSMKPLRGVTPRGWPPGSDWKQVGGAYSPGNREVAIGVGSAGHGSHSLATHEFGHALDDTLDSKQRRDWKSQYEVIDRAVSLDPYFHPLMNTGHVGETFAELYSVWSTGGNVDAGIRAIGRPRDDDDNGREAARTAVAEAFAFFEDILA